MIKVIGIKKILLMIVLAAVLGFFYFYGFMILDVSNKRQENLLSLKQSEISEIEINLTSLVSGVERFDQQKADFENLRALGFFDDQNRVNLRQRLNEMQKISRLISARYTIGAAGVESSEKAKEAGFQVLKTDISFDLEALQDRDIYQFIYLLNYGFPGHVLIDDITLARDVKITPTLIQKIGTGDNTPIVSGKLSVQLRTLVEDLAAKALNANENGGGIQ